MINACKLPLLTKQRIPLFHFIHTMSGKKKKKASLFALNIKKKMTLLDYSKERSVAVKAVLSASKVCQSVFQHLVANETLTKDDKSPVTGKLLKERKKNFFL